MEEITVQQAPNQIGEDLLVIVEKHLVLEMIVDESLEMLVDDSIEMIEDESLDMTVNSIIHVKHLKGTSAMHSYESSDEGRPETHAESDMDSDIRADIEAETADAATTTVAIVDGKPEEAEADEEADVEIQPEGTIEIGVDVTTGIDILNDLPMPDTIERLQQLEESVQEANRNAGLVIESQSQNGDDDDNRNGNHGNNNRDGNQNIGNGGARRNEPVTKACTYKDFLNCQPRNFSGTEGVIALAIWFEKMESVFRISNCPPNSQVKFATCTLLDGALTWNEIHKLENELCNLCVKGTSVAGYTRRFHELTFLCPRIVPEENDKIE
ncbi:hypothetical protein Tco_1398385, partial [Tanacetum coccineum]